MIDNNNPIKQVIIIRKDLRMRRGKEIAQGSHASIAFLTKRLTIKGNLSPSLTDVQFQWLSRSFRKVCLQVNSSKELWGIETAANENEIESHMVVDNGLTEFHGEPTITCLALGPDYDEKIDKLVGHLKLY